MAVVGEIGQIERDFLDRFVRHARSATGGAPSVLDATFESRYFSSLIRFRIQDSGRVTSHIAKFPKAVMRRGYGVMPQRTPDDIRVARQEYDSLLELGKTWVGKASSYTQPIFFDSEVGGFVLNEIVGTDLVNGADKDAAQALTCLGADLAAYHASSIQSRDIDAPQVLEKTLLLKTELETRAGARFPESFQNAVSLAAGRSAGSAALVRAIKGFEIRNARVATSGHIWLFDPGKLKMEPAEADIARFVTSCRMVRWNRVDFIWRTGSEEAERAFVNSYQMRRPINHMLLAFLTTREILKNWLAGIRAAELKALPRWLEKGVQVLYVNRGFGQVMDRHLRSLTQLVSQTG
jgi:hypothetical protein